MGTSAYNIDSNNDYISDKTEVEGFSIVGKQWYLNPLDPDSNGDSLTDVVECPGLNDINMKTDTLDPAFVAGSCLNSDSSTANSDTSPDVFDFDNDGDGVPDTVVDSPALSWVQACRHVGRSRALRQRPDRRRSHGASADQHSDSTPGGHTDNSP